jgi:hypothetical protein
MNVIGVLIGIALIAWGVYILLGGKPVDKEKDGRKIQ